MCQRDFLLHNPLQRRTMRLQLSHNSYQLVSAMGRISLKHLAFGLGSSRGHFNRRSSGRKENAVI